MSTEPRLAARVESVDFRIRNADGALGVQIEAGHPVIKCSRGGDAMSIQIGRGTQGRCGPDLLLIGDFRRCISPGNRGTLSALRCWLVR